MPTVIVSAPLPGNAIDLLRKKNLKVIVGASPYGFSDNELLSILRENPDTLAVLALLSNRMDKRLIENAPRLRVIANYAVGVDNIDLKACKRAGIVVTNTPGVLTEATADLTMALLLDACRNISRGDRLVRADLWRGWSPNLLVGKRVFGATLGIIGLGRIGSAVARRARGFHMKVLYHQRHRADEQIERSLGATWMALDDLLEASDIVTLHCPLTDQTRRMLNRARLAKMKREAVIVNTARGACIDEPALIEALESGHIHAAGLDVYEHEPDVSLALRSLPNVSLAPHLGSADEQTRARMAQMCAESILTVLGDGEPANRVV